ncbi:MAG: SUMF1/EgtB/PvdO family nonheme iron enzyme [Kiritimatiellae bacterium]|nr:SUMF1/EgtB/PvdO family nonheme iron enzyme [Kiritimatiellia bacterium]
MTRAVRLPRHIPAVVMLLAISIPIAVPADLTIDLTFIGNAGNAADDTGYGAVASPFYMGTYEVTVGQYTEFLNLKAASDPFGLYNESMASGPLGAFILRSGSDGSYTYTAVSGKENQPVRWVSWYDGLRLCNWLANGQGNGDTETGSYNLAEGPWALRVSNATWVLPTEDEWYKAAYYDPVNNVYYDYPNGSDTVPAEPTDGVTPRAMNFGDDPYWAPTGTWIYFTSIGETTSASPFGTYDQGGSVAELLETRSVQFPDHMMRGGGFLDDASDLSSSTAYGRDPTSEGDNMGFRIAFLIPEPGTCLLFLLGVGLLAFHRAR